MSEEFNEKLLRVFTIGWNRQKPEEMLALCAENFIHHRPPFPDLVGAEAERQDIYSTFEAFSEIAFNIHELAVDNNTAVMRWTWQARHTGRSTEINVEPAGKYISMQGCSVLHLERGRIVDEWEYADYLSFFSQLGVIHLPE